MSRHDLDELATRVLDAAFEVHRAVGPGLLENAHEMALCHELTLRGIRFERQKELAVIYKGVRLDCGYRLDVIVEDRIILELKSCEQLLPIHQAILLNDLKLSGQTRIPHQFQRVPAQRRHQTHRGQPPRNTNIKRLENHRARRVRRGSTNL